MNGDDLLRESLGDLAESVTNVDMLDRTLARSKRIGRQRATAVTAAACAVLGLAGFGLLGFPHGRPDVPPPVAASPVIPHPSLSASAPATPPSTPSTSPARSSTAGGNHPTKATLATPQSRSLTDLPGRVFYRGDDGTVQRLTPSGTRTTVLDTPNEAAAVSPDGKRVAYVSEGKLRLAGVDAPIYPGAVSADQQTLAWSPDGTRLLIGTPAPKILTVDTGTAKALPSGLGGVQFRWSGDGGTLVYGTTSCRLKVAAANAGSGRTVPNIGDPDNTRNPDQTAACKPLGVDRTGKRAALPLQSVGSTPDGDTADALVDTTTGAVVPIPVPGNVRSLLFAPDGNLLIRAADDNNRFTLSVLTSDGTLLVQAKEPAALSALTPIAYTR
jgi:TolB protein